MACLITFQNPPIQTDQLLDIFGNDLTKLFEHLFMMNPDKLDMFFDLNNQNYEYAIFSLLYCDKYAPAKFDYLVEKIIHNHNTSQNLNIRKLAFAAYNMLYLGAISFEKTKKSFGRNKKLLKFLNLVIFKSNYNYQGLEKDREFMSFILNNDGENISCFSEKEDDFLFRDIQYGPDQNVVQTFKVIRKISNDY